MKVCRECERPSADEFEFCPHDGGRLIVLGGAAGDPMIGKTLEGRFVLEAVLGAGAMGTVYRARQTTVERPVAVKLLKSELSGDPVLVGRFLREVKALSLLHHPNLLTVHDFGQAEDGRLFVATEFLDGQTLRAILESSGTLSPGRTVEVLRQVAEGLYAAHAKGVVHRDLKPDNLFVVPGPRGKDLVKVLDFGIARVGGEDSDRLTRTGSTVGTPAYMSPEQVQGQSLDARSDLYSLGCVAYEMLAGEPPFSGTSMTSVMPGHLQRQAVAPGDRAAVPEPLSALVMRLLAKRPEDRPADAGALLDLLDGLIGAGPASRPLPSPCSRPRPTSPPWM